jgi:DNA adenine methylase
MWELVKSKPNELAKSYRSHWRAYTRDKKKAYERAKESFNRCQNPQDFLFISRACYGGVIRFRRDGYLSTPIGIHNIISPDTFEQRLADWHQIVKGVNFIHADFETVLRDAGKNDLIYCDPPYGDTQKIVYGAQKFSLERMFSVLLRAKGKGASVALSIDGAKKSGNRIIDVSVPEGLFNSEEFLALGGSMLKRFQRDGEDVKDEKVSDRLLISFLSRQGSLQLA